MMASPVTTRAYDVGGGPPELAAGQRDPHEQHRDTADDQGGAEVVDVHLAAHGLDLERLLQHHEGGCGDREADEEAPAPAERRVDDDPTDERAAHRGQREDGTDVAGVAAALARAHHARDDDLDERREAADAEALDRTRADQHLHGRREPRDDRAGAEDQQRALDEHLLAEQVGELAPDRGRGRHRQQGRDDDPGVAGLAARQVGHDARQRVGDDGARHHRDEHGEEEAGQGLEHLAVGHHAVGGVVSGGGGGGSSLGAHCLRGRPIADSSREPTR